MGLGVTGVAGPDPQDGVAVGTVYIAVSRDGSGGLDETVAEQHYDGDREAIREQAVQACVRALLQAASTLD
jgi:nicotinamide-nucleotide amidase